MALPHAGEMAPGPGLGPASDAWLSLISHQLVKKVENQLFEPIFGKNSPNLERFLRKIRSDSASTSWEPKELLMECSVWKMRS